MEDGDGGAAQEERAALAACGMLLRCAALCEGLSGRTLRKLPFLAHASLAAQHGAARGGGGLAAAGACELSRFLRALEEAAIQEHLERGQL